MSQSTMYERERCIQCPLLFFASYVMPVWVDVALVLSAA